MNREFEIIQRFLRSGKDAAHLNKSFQKIHDEQGIGHIMGSYIWFNARDREGLRGWFKDRTGIDPLVESSIPEDRISVACVGINEKLARKNVFAGQLKVAAPIGYEVQTINGPAITPRGTNLLVPSDHLILEEAEVIIVENGAVMRSINDLQFEQPFANPLFIYRGHESDARELKIALAAYPPACVIGFYDFDPAGMLMGLESKSDSLIFPKLSEENLEQSLLTKINQAEKFWTQAHQMSRLKTKAPETLLPFVEMMERLELAIMQEHIVAHQMMLSRYDL
ncbi:hypothetical protein LH51_12195 [Nitrincola sp. A-D6]|uniref:DUF7281 domain-containing protein n=1 Tax=Nitrincola sp. A-D6 TaxID=1545442 RepID=UPI00051FB5BC|nr:hypothetical protein [Nitrincola sp. A-D6]KGK41785.1 hypothetical protein LH51_12195 [Nitrincola sp. A-D6]